MRIIAPLKSALRAIARPQLILPAAVVLAGLVLSATPVQQASAQGFSIGGGGGGGGYSNSRHSNRSRYLSPNARRSSPGYERSGRRGMGSPESSGRSRYTKSDGHYRRPHQHPRYPRRDASQSSYPKTATHHPRHPRYPRPGSTADTSYPKTDSHYPKRPRHPRPPHYPRPGSTADTRYPTTDTHYPRPPRYPRPRPPITTTETQYPKGETRYPRPPRPPITRPVEVVAIPGGSGGPPAVAPPPNSAAGGGSPPPSTPPVQSGRRPGTGVPPANENRYVPNEVVVELAPGASNQAINALLNRHRLTRLQSFNLQLTGTTIQRLRINDRRTVPQVVRALEADGFVMAAQPNYIATLQEASPQGALPADLEQYALLRMRLQEAHQLVTGSRILIGVIDGGVDTSHPELAGTVVNSFDAIGTGDRRHPHGTSIVGAIAARARLRGTAPGAHILAARAFGSNRNSMDGTTTNILLAIDWTVQRGARVINMSFAGARDPAIERLLDGARQRGIVLIAAAGNAGPNSPPLYPAALPGVIAVTATDENDRIFRAANHGNHITIAAPGVDLWLPTVDRGYRITSGTSFAAAEVSGLVALLLERNPRLTPDQVRRILIATARDLGPRGQDPQFGAGLIDAYRAVMSVVPQVSAPVTAGASAR